jgi:hypothetical protein
MGGMANGEEKTNPYEPSRTLYDDRSRKTEAGLKQKCAQLLTRRNEIDGTLWWYYLKRDWRRQLTFGTAYAAICGSLWYLGFQLLTVALIGFIAGRSIRDLRWWAALSKEWPMTRELLDWQKIEEIARQ